MRTHAPPSSFVIQLDLTVTGMITTNEANVTLKIQNRVIKARLRRETRHLHRRKRRGHHDTPLWLSLEMNYLNRQLTQ